MTRKTKVLAHDLAHTECKGKPVDAAFLAVGEWTVGGIFAAMLFHRDERIQGAVRFSGAEIARRVAKTPEQDAQHEVEVSFLWLYGCIIW